jgi:hypothetical protein
VTGPEIPVPGLEIPVTGLEIPVTGPAALVLPSAEQFQAVKLDQVLACCAVVGA